MGFGLHLVGGFPGGEFCRDRAPAARDMRGGCRPLCTPHEGALRPSTPAYFHFTMKVGKGVPGALPLDPVGGHYHPPSDALRRSPQKGYAAPTQMELPL